MVQLTNPLQSDSLSCAMTSLAWPAYRVTRTSKSIPASLKNGTTSSVKIFSAFFCPENGLTMTSNFGLPYPGCVGYRLTETSGNNEVSMAWTQVSRTFAAIDICLCCLLGSMM